jgi:hypothetical protein
MMNAGEVNIKVGISLTRQEYSVLSYEIPGPTTQVGTGNNYSVGPLGTTRLGLHNT